MSSTTAHLSMIRQAMTAAGGTFPKAVAQALDDREKLTEGAAAMTSPSPDAIAAAVADALAAGRDPLDDEAVRRLATASVLCGTSGNALTGGVARATEARVVQALTDDVDAILDTYGTAVYEAGQVLTAAWRILGDLDLSDSAAVLKMGPDASRAWTDAREAQARIRTIERGWYALAEVTRFASSTPVAQTLRLANLSLEQVEHVVGRKAEPWAIVRAGVTIELADRESIRARVERLETERNARENEHAERFTNEYRRKHVAIVKA